MIRFSKEVKASVSCLTTYPDQFYDLSIIETKRAAKVLSDSIADLIDSVSNV